MPVGDGSKREIAAAFRRPFISAMEPALVRANTSAARWAEMDPLLELLLSGDSGKHEWGGAGWLPLVAG